MCPWGNVLTYFIHLIQTHILLTLAYYVRYSLSIMYKLTGSFSKHAVVKSLVICIRYDMYPPMRRQPIGGGESLYIYTYIYILYIYV